MTDKKAKALKLALEANTALREWINAVPKETVLPAMPGFDVDWLDSVEAVILEELAEQPAQQAPVKYPTNGELEELWRSHVGHPADFAAHVLERWGGAPSGLMGYGGSLNKPAAPQPAQRKPLTASGQLAKRRIFDCIRGAYDLGYSDARNAKAVPGDNAPGYKGRDVEADHGSALLHALEAITSPPAQQQEPVLWRGRELAEEYWTTYWSDPTGLPGVDVVEPLYTYPQPSKPLEGLTDEQIAEIAATPAAIPGSYIHSFARAIEAAHGIKGDA